MELKASIMDLKRNLINLKVIAWVIILQACGVGLANSAVMSEPEFRTAAHCESKEDYEGAKKGTFGISGVDLTIKENSLIVKAQVAVNQCKKHGDKTYQWGTVNPYDGLEFEHEYFDFEKNRFVSRKTRIEYKRVWLTVVNSTPKIVGTGDVAQTKKQLLATVIVPLNQIATTQQIASINAGNEESLKVSLFVKGLMRYVSGDETTPYDESSGLGLYDIDFKLSKVNGVMTIN